MGYLGYALMATHPWYNGGAYVVMTCAAVDGVFPYTAPRGVGDTRPAGVQL